MVTPVQSSHKPTLTHRVSHHRRFVLRYVNTHAGRCLQNGTRGRVFGGVHSVLRPVDEEAVVFPVVGVVGVSQGHQLHCLTLQRESRRWRDVSDTQSRLHLARAQLETDRGPEEFHRHRCPGPEATSLCYKPTSASFRTCCRMRLVELKRFRWSLIIILEASQISWSGKPRIGYTWWGREGGQAIINKPKVHIFPAFRFS